MVIGVYSAKYVTTPVLRESSSSTNSRPMSDIQDRRSEFKGLCNVPTSNMKLSFGVNPWSAAASARKVAQNEKKYILELFMKIAGDDLRDFRLKTVTSWGKKLSKKPLVEDAFAARAVTDGSQARTDAIIARIAQNAKKGRLKVVRVGNHAANGEGVEPYLSEANKKLLIASQTDPINFEKHGKYDRGFTAANIKFVTPKGTRFELQIMGDKVYKLIEPSSVWQKLEMGDFSPRGNKLREKALWKYNNLKPDQKKAVNTYLSRAFAHYRVEELRGEDKKLGRPVRDPLPMPELRPDVPRIFTLKGLKQIKAG